MTELTVLLCTDHLPPSGGGVEHVVETHATMLDEAGVDVVVYTLDTGDEQPALCEHDSVTVVQSNGFDLTSIIGLQSAVSPCAFRDYPRLLEKFDPDIVHVHNRFFFTNVVATLFRGRTDCPLITTLHVGDLGKIDGIGGHLASVFEQTVSRAIVSRSDHIICVSDSVTDVASSLNGSEVSVIKNAVDIEEYSPLPTPDDTLTLLYVGRLVRNNGPQDLVRALPGVLDAVPELSVEIVGKGHMESQLREEVAASGYGDRVTIHGYVDNLKQMYDNADVFCRPSYSEGLPLTLLESMACGIPPVVTPVAGVPEVITDGENGLLVPCNDPESLGEALREILESPDERERIATNARETVEANHSWQHRCDRIRELYESALSG